MLDDGVYGLSFIYGASDGGRPADGGEGLAVLRGGRILGSDRHGGVFKGHCRYDPERDAVTVAVRLAVPPHGVLLTGREAGPDGAFLDIAACFPPPRPVSSAIVDLGGAPVAVQLRYVGPLGG